MNARNYARLKFLGIVAIFLAPPALAYLLYDGFSYRGAAATNHGDLVRPAQPLPALTLKRGGAKRVSSRQALKTQWTLLQLTSAGCRRACRDSLDKTRQVRALLHQDTVRVQRVLLVAAGQPWPRLDRQPDLKIYRTRLSPLIRLFARHGADRPGVVYVIDPLGNWMLYYPSGADIDGLFKDIKHLLKLSHIG